MWIAHGPVNHTVWGHADLAHTTIGVIRRSLATD
jgi:hypothetical protein